MQAAITTQAELLTNASRTRGDLQMLQMAVRKGWAIPDHVYEKAGLVISQILAKGSNREKVAAARVLIAMNEQNNPSPVLVAHQHIHQVAGGDAQETADEQKRRELSQRIARLR